MDSEAEYPDSLFLLLNFFHYHFIKAKTRSYPNPLPRYLYKPLALVKACKDFLLQQTWYTDVVYRIFSNGYIKFLKQYTSVFHLLSLSSCSPWMWLKLIAKLPCIHEAQALPLGVLIYIYLLLLLFLKTLINWSCGTRCVWCLEAFRAHEALQGWQSLCYLVLRCM